ncbi:MAG: flagellar biosynthetic protein FliO [Desulforegulaceae bacterium]|nr:flagellar biosynthetic protein FliO [Desulforegulaceae bacterium]
MEPGSINLYAELFKTLGMFAIVLGILGGCLYLVKRFMAKNFSMGDKSEIRLISSFYLGSREKLIIIDADGEKLLIGVTKESITLISKLGKTDKETEKKEENTQEFSKIFKENLKSRFFLKKEKKD